MRWNNRESCARDNRATQPNHRQRFAYTRLTVLDRRSDRKLKAFLVTVVLVLLRIADSGRRNLLRMIQIERQKLGSSAL